jgi:hypothetical protein
MAITTTGENSEMSAEDHARQSALASPYRVRKKHAEATKQQDGARRQRNVRHQSCQDAGEQHDRNDCQRERAIVDEQPS